MFQKKCLLKWTGPTWPNHVSLNLQKSLKVFQPFHFVIQISWCSNCFKTRWKLKNGLYALNDDSFILRILFIVSFSNGSSVFDSISFNKSGTFKSMKYCLQLQKYAWQLLPSWCGEQGWQEDQWVVVCYTLDPCYTTEKHLLESSSNLFLWIKNHCQYYPSLTFSNSQNSWWRRRVSK